jgi:hypothetical protein
VLIAVPGYWFTVAFCDTVGRIPIQYMGFFMMTAILIVLAAAYWKVGCLPSRDRHTDTHPWFAWLLPTIVCVTSPSPCGRTPGPVATLSCMAGCRTPRPETPQSELHLGHDKETVIMWGASPLTRSLT